MKVKTQDGKHVPHFGAVMRKTLLLLIMSRQLGEWECMAISRAELIMWFLQRSLLIKIYLGYKSGIFRFDDSDSIYYTKVPKHSDLVNTFPRPFCLYISPERKDQLPLLAFFPHGQIKVCQTRIIVLENFSTSKCMILEKKIGHYKIDLVCLLHLIYLSIFLQTK